jgi:hypothetical protein
VAIATDDFDEETDTLPEAPETLAVPDEPCEMRREVGLTLRLLLDELLELLPSSAWAETARRSGRPAHMSPLNMRTLKFLNMGIPLSVITMWEIFPPAH